MVMVSKNADKSDRKPPAKKKPAKRRSRAAPRLQPVASPPQAVLPTRMYSDAEIVAAVHATSGRVYLAADKLGCHPDTIYDRAKASREVGDAIMHARERLLDKAEAGLAAAVARKAGWAIQFMLKTKGKSRGYTEKQDGEHGGTSVNVQVNNVLAGLSNEQLEEILRRPVTPGVGGDEASGGAGALPAQPSPLPR